MNIYACTNTYMTEIDQGDNVCGNRTHNTHQGHTLVSTTPVQKLWRREMGLTTSSSSGRWGERSCGRQGTKIRRRRRRWHQSHLLHQGSHFHSTHDRSVALWQSSPRRAMIRCRARHPGGSSTSRRSCTAPRSTGSRSRELPTGALWCTTQRFRSTRCLTCRRRHG